MNHPNELSSNNYIQLQQIYIQRNREIQQKIEELKEDEIWKAQNCKYCPSCHKVAYKINGTDTIVCGGGYAEQGCGNTFRWSEAEAYQPRPF